MSFGVSWMEYTALVEFPESFVEKFDGARITAVEIVSPDNFEDPKLNNFTDLTLCFYDEPDGELLYSQAATLSTVAFSWNNIKLDTPRLIEAGKPFFVGYSGKAPTIDDACFVVDWAANSDEVGLWLGWTDDYTGERIWEPFTESYGNLCLRLVIEGDNLPNDEATLQEMYFPGSVVTGENFSVLAVVTNGAANNIESVTLDYSCGGMKGTAEATLSPALPYGKTTTVLIDGLKCDSVGARVPVEYTLAAVNGNRESVITDKSDHSTAMVISIPAGKGFDRNVVMEEGTGTWCGYCPLGIVATDSMKTKYTDGSFIPVSIHVNDEMAPDSYQKFADRYFGGSYPKAVINRDTLRMGAFSPSLDRVESLYETARDMKAYAKIMADVEYVAGDKPSLRVDTRSGFAIPLGDDTFSVEFALLQDNVGPYTQKNFFADWAEGEPMGGFEDLPFDVELMYNDVARILYPADSISGHLPSPVVPGEEYAMSFTLPIPEGMNGGNLSLVAMLVNDVTGEIENAQAVAVSGFSGVTEIGGEASSMTVRSAGGVIYVSGADSTVRIYTPDGTLRAEIEGEGSANVGAGIYMVENRGTVKKIVVR